MTAGERDRRLEELYAEADRRGCCVVPAEPVPEADGSPGTDRPAASR